MRQQELKMFMKQCHTAWVLRKKFLNYYIGRFKVQNFMVYPNIWVSRSLKNNIESRESHTSLMLLIWQMPAAVSAVKYSSSWRWAGWLFSEDDVPSRNLSLFFSSSQMLDPKMIHKWRLYLKCLKVKLMSYHK